VDAQPGRLGGRSRIDALDHHSLIRGERNTGLLARLRRHRPCAIRSSAILIAALMGTANPIPTLAPVGEAINSLMPINCPSMFASAPPELPGLHYRDIGEVIFADHPGPIGLPCELDGDPCRIIHDMGVRQDRAVPPDDDPGSRAPRHDPRLLATRPRIREAEEAPENRIIGEG
jgi:hypothetical protein